jgi:hypothetical protein
MWFYHQDTLVHSVDASRISAVKLFKFIEEFQNYNLFLQMNFDLFVIGQICHTLRERFF